MGVIIIRSKETSLEFKNIYIITIYIYNYIYTEVIEDICDLVLHELLVAPNCRYETEQLMNLGWPFATEGRTTLTVLFWDSLMQSLGRKVSGGNLWSATFGKFAEVLSSGCWSTQLLALVIGCYRSCMVLQQPAHLTALVCLVFQQTAGAERLLSQWSLWTSSLQLHTHNCFLEDFQGRMLTHWTRTLPGFCPQVESFLRLWLALLLTGWVLQWAILSCSVPTEPSLFCSWSIPLSEPAIPFQELPLCVLLSAGPFSIPWIRCFVVDILGSPTLEQALAWLWPLLASAIYWYSLWRLWRILVGFLWSTVSWACSNSQRSFFRFGLWNERRRSTVIRFLTQAHSLIL